MLPKSLLNYVIEDTPTFTESIANGLATTHALQIESYIDSVFRAVSTGFPEGLKYIGYRRLTPAEELAEVTKPRNNRRAYDVAPSSVHMVEFKFSFTEDGATPNTSGGTREFSRILYVPYIGEAGTMYISGSRYVVSPVLADRIFSVGEQSMFVRILKARLMFNRLAHAYRTNSGLENQLVVHCRVYNEETKQRNRLVKCESTMVHYLLGKYGLSTTFLKFLGFAPVVGGEEINEENYPPSEWVICASTGVKPRKVRVSSAAGGLYRPTNIRLAIKRSDFTPLTKQFVAGFFYIVDHYPDRMSAELVENTDEWRILLGRVIWDEEPSKGTALADVSEHYKSLDDYLDILSAKKLANIGHPVNDIYELFVVVMRNFSTWMAEAPDRVATMYEKELSILPFICYPYNDAFNKLLYRLRSNQPRGLTHSKVQEMFAKFLKMGLIFGLSRESGLLSSASTSGDCYALRWTNIVVPQSGSNKLRGRPRPTLTDPAKQLHPSIAEVGQYSAMPKSAPDGRQRLNLCVRVDSTGMIIRDPNLEPLIESVRTRIAR